MSARGPAWAAAALLACAGAARGMVNPQLQPSHLVERYRAVIGGRIVRADLDAGQAVIRVTHVCTGAFAPKQITIAVREVDEDEPSLFDDARKGGVVVAYVHKRRRRHEREALLYAGRQWHEVEVLDPAKPSAWKWTEALGDRMVGTFNGAAEQLLAMMIDAAAGRDFFPAYPSVKFKPSLRVGTFAAPLRGVAIYDLDADGRADLYACCEKGNRAYLQTPRGEFDDATARLGLGRVRSASCSFADANADGRADLLADGAIYLGSKRGFARSSLLPASAEGRVRCAAFVEINGDGRPDVVVSRAGGGLAVYLNRGAAGGAQFIDVTAAAGLDRKEAGAGLTGFFAPGDWNGDGRTDLYYAAGHGLILVQDARGVFRPAEQRFRFDYAVAGTHQAGLTGAGCFAPLLRPGRFDLVSPGDMHLTLVTNDGGRLRNVTADANEVKVCRVSQLATLAEDLNVDGRVDLFTLSRAADVKNIFHANRGYGSFMLAELYADYDPFPGKAYTVGAWGVAAGDVNDDGAPDLLLGGVDGVLRLAVNDAFSHPLRRRKDHPTALEKTLSGMRIVSVKVTGRIGVVGADVRLTDAAGRVLARRSIGSHVLTGCRGPDAVDLAVREGGRHRLRVRFSDGRTRSWTVDLTQRKRVKLVARREAAQPKP